MHKCKISLEKLRSQDQCVYYNRTGYSILVDQSSVGGAFNNQREQIKFFQIFPFSRLYKEAGHCKIQLAFGESDASRLVEF